MASPQIENGYLKIANEIIDEFCRINLSNYEWKILLAIVRKTYGYNKKEDFISLSQLSKLTRIPSSHCCRTLRKLRNKNMITTTQIGRGMTQKVALQKDFEKWRTTTNSGITQIGITQTGRGLLPKQVVELLPKQVVELLPKQVDTKDKRKDKRKDNIKNIYMCDFDLFWKTYPKKVNKAYAIKVWSKLKPSQELTNTIISAVERAKKSNEWTKDKGQFIPHPSTYLNNKRWEDELTLKEDAGKYDKYDRGEWEDELTINEEEGGKYDKYD